MPPLPPEPYASVAPDDEDVLAAPLDVDEDAFPIPAPPVAPAAPPAHDAATEPAAPDESAPAAPPAPPAPPTPPTPIAMPDVRALAFTLCAMPAEYLAQCDPWTAGVLRNRLVEARLPFAAQEQLIHYPDFLHFIAVVAADLPDTPALLPLWMRMAAAMPRAELRVVDEPALPLLERLLGDEDDVDLDALELPALLIFDEEWHYQGRWGPRPQAAETLLDGWLADNPDYEALADSDAAHDAWLALNDQLVLQMRVWYNSGLDAACIGEILPLLLALQDESEGAEAEMERRTARAD